MTDLEPRYTLQEATEVFYAGKVSKRVSGIRTPRDTHRKTWKQGFLHRRRHRCIAQSHSREEPLPRRRMPARLILRKARADRAALWVIVDRAKELGTGVGADDVTGAQEALQRYLAGKHLPPAGELRPARLLVAEGMATYLREHAATSRSRAWLCHTAEPIAGGWVDRGQGATESKKRQPPAPLRTKLLPHARRWQKADLAKDIASVIHSGGRPIRTKVRRSWETARNLAKHPRRDSPHILQLG